MKRTLIAAGLFVFCTFIGAVRSNAKEFKEVPIPPIDKISIEDVKNAGERKDATSLLLLLSAYGNPSLHLDLREALTKRTDGFSAIWAAENLDSHDPVKRDLSVAILENRQNPIYLEFYKKLYDYHLVDRTSAESLDSQIRRSVVLAHNGRKDTESLELTRVFLKDPNYEIRRLAALHLIKLKDNPDKKIETFISEELLTSPDAAIHATALNALLFRDARYFLRFINHPDPVLRQSLVKGFVTYHLDHPQALDFLELAANDKDAEVREAVADGLLILPVQDSRVISLFRKFTNSATERAPLVRKTAYSSLAGQLETSEALEIFLGGFSESIDVLGSVVEASQLIKDINATEVIRAMLASKNKIVQNEGVRRVHAYSGPEEIGQSLRAEVERDAYLKDALRRIVKGTRLQFIPKVVRTEEETLVCKRLLEMPVASVWFQ